MLDVDDAALVLDVDEAESELALAWADDVDDVLWL